MRGVPVTPPKIKGQVTYHTVRLTDREGTSPSVELLIQDCNLYLIAVRIITNVDDKDGEVYFVFKDRELPKFMMGDFINYTMRYGKARDYPLLFIVNIMVVV